MEYFEYKKLIETLESTHRTQDAMLSALHAIGTYLCGISVSLDKISSKLCPGVLNYSAVSAEPAPTEIGREVEMHGEQSEDDEPYESQTTDGIPEVPYRNDSDEARRGNGNQSEPG